MEVLVYKAVGVWQDGYDSEFVKNGIKMFLEMESVRIFKLKELLYHCCVVSLLPKQSD